ncbi:MAG: hypothetical protein D6786_10680 [Gammaproteobacteria bacterium]|nr:MAG: hypothetical protein D6786_10680 [Gammaproteobacteria bacterium]
MKGPLGAPAAPAYSIGEDGSVSLRICFNSSCRRTEWLRFTADEVAQVTSLLELCPSPDLRSRLQRLRIAVWQMERLAGLHEPLLANDREVNDRDIALDGHTDCVDNATNTTTYLSILKDLGKLPGWRVGEPRVRDPLDFNQVHWTAMVVDEQTGAEWSVDSWFRPNGHLPFVLPLRAWKEGARGWAPPYASLNPYPRYRELLCPREGLAEGRVSLSR